MLSPLMRPSANDPTDIDLHAVAEPFHSADLDMISIHAELEENAFTLGMRSSNSKHVIEFSKGFARELHGWLSRVLKD